MNAEHPSPLLSIGEFSAATQLTPKALRLYDEQRLMIPASTDSANGYRYYRNDQVATGRLIRTLRDMSLSLVQIAAVVSVEGGSAEALLRSFAQDLDRRFAREKQAFQAALMRLRAATPSAAPVIDAFDRAALTVIVQTFAADRTTFFERFATERRRIQADALAAGLSLDDGEAYCSLVDPLTDDEGRMEVVLPIIVAGDLPQGFTIRKVAATHCAAVTANTGAHASEFAGALDALFDWFDRHGRHAVGTPWVSIVSGDAGPITKIIWACESLAPVTR